MPDRYSKFLRQQNIIDFEEKLKTESDPIKREMLIKLLADERAGKLSPPITDGKP